MTWRLGVVVTAAALVGGGAAWGQATPTAQAEQPAASGAASSSPVTDAELTSFAQATLKLHELPHPTPEQMNEAIAGAGLPVERYNEIAARMQADAAFRTRVNAALLAANSAASAGPRGASAGSTAPTPAPPPLPTAGVAASVLGVLDRVCLPMVRQDRKIGEVAPAAGLRRNKRDESYSASLEGGKAYSIKVFPRGANQAVCNVELRHPLGRGEEIATALNIWTMHQSPPLEMVRNDTAVGADGLKRTTLSWERTAAGRLAGLVFVRVERPDGTPVEKGVGSATLLYSERPS